MRTAADFDPVYQIVADHIERDDVGSDNYFSMIDELNAREEAIRTEHLEEVKQLKAQLEQMKRVALTLGEIGIAFADIAITFNRSGE